MNKLLKEIYIPASERNLLEAKRLYDKCISYGITLDKNCLFSYNPDSFTSTFFHKEITNLC